MEVVRIVDKLANAGVTVTPLVHWSWTKGWSNNDIEEKHIQHSLQYSKHVKEQAYYCGQDLAWTSSGSKPRTVTSRLPPTGFGSSGCFLLFS